MMGDAKSKSAAIVNIEDVNASAMQDTEDAVLRFATLLPNDTRSEKDYLQSQPSSRYPEPVPVAPAPVTPSKRPLEPSDQFREGFTSALDHVTLCKRKMDKLKSLKQRGLDIYQDQKYKEIDYSYRCWPQGRVLIPAQSDPRFKARLGLARPTFQPGDFLISKADRTGNKNNCTLPIVVGETFIFLETASPYFEVIAYQRTGLVHQTDCLAVHFEEGEDYPHTDQSLDYLFQRIEFSKVLPTLPSSSTRTPSSIEREPRKARRLSRPISKPRKTDAAYDSSDDDDEEALSPLDKTLIKETPQLDGGNLASLLVDQQGLTHRHLLSRPYTPSGRNTFNVSNDRHLSRGRSPSAVEDARSSEGLLISAVGKRHAHPADEGTNPLRKKTEQPKEMPLPLRLLGSSFFTKEMAAMTKGRQAPPRLIIQPTSRIRKNPDDSLGAQEAGKDIQNVDLAAVAENLEAEKSHDALEDTKNALRIPTEKYEHATDKHSFNSKHEQEQVPLSSRVRFSRGASLEIGRALGMQQALGELYSGNRSPYLQQEVEDSLATDEIDEREGHRVNHERSASTSSCTSTSSCASTSSCSSCENPISKMAVHEHVHPVDTSPEKEEPARLVCPPTPRLRTMGEDFVDSDAADSANYISPIANYISPISSAYYPLTPFPNHPQTDRLSPVPSTESPHLSRASQAPSPVATEYSEEAKEEFPPLTRCPSNMDTRLWGTPQLATSSQVYLEAARNLENREGVQRQRGYAITGRERSVDGVFQVWEWEDEVSEQYTREKEDGVEEGKGNTVADSEATVAADEDIAIAADGDTDEDALYPRVFFSSSETSPSVSPQEISARPPPRHQLPFHHLPLHRRSASMASDGSTDTVIYVGNGIEEGLRRVRLQDERFDGGDGVYGERSESPTLPLQIGNVPEISVVDYGDFGEGKGVEKEQEIAGRNSPTLNNGE